MIKPRKFFTKFRDLLVAELEERFLTLLVECGAGKTSIGAAAAYDLFRLGAIDAMVWLVPRRLLICQAEDAMNWRSRKSRFIWKDLLGAPDDIADKLRINALVDGNPSTPNALAAGTFGYACTFSAFVQSESLHMDFLKRHRCLVIADEIQLCEQDSAFGSVIDRAKEHAAFFIAMSGDFDRPGRTEVAGVEYILSDDSDGANARIVRTDLEYNIYEALQDRAIIPLDFCYGKGPVRFTKDDTPLNFKSFQEVPAKLASDAVSCAVSPEYSDALLTECVESFRGHRTDGRVANRRVLPQPDAQMLVVCADQAQARAIHRQIIEKHGFSPADCALAISDDANSGDALEDFKEGRRSVAVTVAMAYIGMDAPKISHLCCLTHYRTPSWLHQMLARAWRLSPSVEDYSDQYAVCFAPNDKKFMDAIGKIRAAIQLGAIDHETGMGSGGGGEGTAGDHWASVSATENRFEFVTDEFAFCDLEPSDDSANVAIADIPPEQEMRESLLLRGFTSAQTEAAIVALYGSGQATVDPVTDTRTPRQVRDDLRAELTFFQNKTAAMLARGKPRTEHFKRVNVELLRMSGWSRDAINEDISKLRRCVNEIAPRVRRRILGDA